MTLTARANIPVILALLAVMAVVAAIWVSSDSDQTRPGTEAGSLMLPDFRSVAADVTTLTLRAPDSTATLLKVDDGWRVAERDNYPADVAAINGLLRGLARAELQEPKTGDPARLPRIGLGEAATVLEARASDGASLLELQVGNSTMRGPERTRWTFVQRAADAHAWLVSGLVSDLGELSADPARYLDKTAADISKARVGRVEVTHYADKKSAGSYTLSRSGPMAEFTVDQVGDGENFFAPAVAAATAAALDGLQLDDIAPRAADREEAGDPLATMTYAMWDGLRVHLRLYEDTEGARWVTLDASYDASAAIAATAPRVMPDAPADGAAEAAELNLEWSRWRYRIQTELGDDDLARPRSDFVRSEIPVD